MNESLRYAILQQLKDLENDLDNTITDLKEFEVRNNEFITKKLVFQHILKLFALAQTELKTFVLDEIFPEPFTFKKDVE